MKLCPYCQSDQSELFAIMAGDMAQPAKGAVGICHECGELMLVTEGAFRKPTVEEHVKMHGVEEIRIARAAWEAHKTHTKGPPLQAGWHHYRDTALRNIDERVHEHLRGTFYAGAAVMLTLIRKAADQSGSYEEFEGHMLLYEAEIAAYAESRTNKRDKKDGRFT